MPGFDSASCAIHSNRRLGTQYEDQAAWSGASLARQRKVLSRKLFALKRRARGKALGFNESQNLWRLQDDIRVYCDRSMLALLGRDQMKAICVRLDSKRFSFLHQQLTRILGRALTGFEDRRKKLVARKEIESPNRPRWSGHPPFPRHFRGSYECSYHAATRPPSASRSQ